MSDIQERKFYHFNKQKFETRVPVLTKIFKVDCGSLLQNTTSVVTNLEAGDKIVGLHYIVDEAFGPTGAATVLVGFTGTTMVVAADDVDDLVLDFVGVPTSEIPVTLAATDGLDVTTSDTVTLTSGKLTIVLTYIPAIDRDDTEDVDHYVLVGA